MHEKRRKANSKRHFGMRQYYSEIPEEYFSVQQSLIANGK